MSCRARRSPAHVPRLRLCKPRADPILRIDRNQTRHAYVYDLAGRPLSDAADPLGPGVDPAVRRLSATWDALTRPRLLTSHDHPSAGAVVNQVRRLYNGNGLSKLVDEFQAHAGTVSGSTPALGMAYSEMGGGANHSRLAG